MEYKNSKEHYYDLIIAEFIGNISKLCNDQQNQKVVLKSFNPKHYQDKLIFSMLDVLRMYSDLEIYLDMNIIKYLFFRLKNRKNIVVKRKKKKINCIEINSKQYATIIETRGLQEGLSTQLDFDIFVAFYKERLK